MTLRNVLFQVHWFLGITAGLVLALVGVTGGVLSFEHELIEAWNPGIVTVQPRGTALAPEALLEKVRAQRPEASVQSLVLAKDPHLAARVGFAPDKNAKASGPGGRGPRGETLYVDPYSGQLLGKPRGEGFFRTNMQLHRWLAMDDVGKQIVAFATVALLYFCLSGLYLRWPRRWGSLRTWLALDWKQKGRNFLWHLHSVFGTWVLIAYLVMSLTGLWWSYGWYRDALNRWAEMPQQQQRGEGPRRSGGEAGRGEGRGERGSAGERSAPELDAAAAWATFRSQVPAWSTATLQWPREGNGVQFRYLDADPPHERANNTLELDPSTLAVRKHERYDARPLKQKLVGSMFALHRGSYFGTAGVVLFMLASVLMPLFAITGWMLYLERRKRQREAKRLAAASTLPAVGAGSGERMLVAFASQTGNAQRLAWQTASALADAGVAVEIKPLGQLSPEALASWPRALFVVSTFGESQAPDGARGLARRMRSAPDGLLAGLQYGLLALGDREYGEDFCGFGRDLDQWLHHAGAQPLFDRVEVDGLDAGTIRHWQHHIGLLSGHTELPDWSPPDYAPWALVERRHLNPGSPGGPIFHLALRPADGALPDWQAGDIAEVGSRHVPAAVAAYLDASGHDGAATVAFDGHDTTLADALALGLWPDAAAARGMSAQALADALQPLPHREYSIASLPTDGSVDLLLRQMRRPDGSLGLGSGWLTEAAPIGGEVALRIRANPGFHPPADARPLLLIGNGTGIAGLRALLKARIAAGHRNNWLIFGERTRAHDFHHGQDLAEWQAQGDIERLDLAFSRDGTGPRYVQHLMREQVDALRAWLQRGAAVYVCGSLEGMAPAVEAELIALVGQDELDRMAADGRYRRDVY